VKVLVVLNFDDTGLGQVATALEEVAAEVETVRAHKGEPLPSGPSGYDAIVVLGGGQNARDDDTHPYLPHLAALMRSFVESGRSTLGICLGSQILARAFGAENLIGRAKEFGWHEVALSRQAAEDAVLSVLPERFPIFHWHDDTFALPEGAVRLAESAVTRNQAFRVGRAGYGIQFHFEADRTLVAHWNEAFAAYITERHPDWPGRFAGEAARHGPAADEAGLALARAWVATIR
jgi:GMP synthase-like glutamine amidotransferase